ncbi:MAG: EamA family transporter [Eubacterium sp.]|nr:EamA family transporter [Eubacterium sp.]
MNKGYIYILITAFAFSTMEIAGKMISSQFNPFQLTFLRFAIGGLVLLPLAIREIKKRKLRLSRGDFAFFALTGIIGILISMSFFQLAILNTKASIVAVIFSTNFVFTIPFAVIFLKEKFSKRTFLAIVTSIFGIFLIFNPFNVNPDMKGILLAFAAAIAFSLFSVTGKTRIHKYGGLILNSFSFIIGNIFLLVFLLFFKVPVFSGINPGNLPHLLYLGIFVTGIGYLCYFEAMKHTSAITASMVFFIKPALAPVLALLILRESISLQVFAGIVCVIAASLIIFLRRD